MAVGCRLIQKLSFYCQLMPTERPVAQKWIGDMSSMAARAIGQKVRKGDKWKPLNGQKIVGHLGKIVM